MNDIKNVLLNTIFQVFGKFTSAFLSLLALKIITNSLSQSEYGDYLTLFEFVGFFAIAANFGLFTTTVTEISVNPKIKNKIFGNILGIRIVIIMFFCLLASISGGIIFEGKTYMQTGILIVVLITVMDLLSENLTSLLQVSFKMGKATIAKSISKIIFLVLIYYFSLNSNGIEIFYNYLLASAWASLAMLVLIIFFSSGIASFVPRFDISFWKKIIKKSLPYGIALLLIRAIFKIDVQMIYFLRSSVEAGIYGIAITIIEVFSFLPIFFMNSVMPILSPAIKKNKEKTKKIVQYSFDFLFLMGAPILVGIFIVSKNIILLLGNEKYLSDKNFWGSDWILNLLAIAMFFAYLGVLFEFLLIALKKQEKLLLASFLGVICNLILNFIFIPIYGIIAAAITSILCDFLILILKIIFTKKYFKCFSLNLSNSYRIIFSALLMGIISFYINKYFGFLPCMLGSFIFYSFLILGTKVVDFNFLNKLLSVKKTCK